ncbi:MAG: hypothetical protein ACI308_03090 [Muribaculaceae bacterium]
MIYYHLTIISHINMGRVGFQHHYVSNYLCTYLLFFANFAKPTAATKSDAGTSLLSKGELET